MAIKGRGGKSGGRAAKAVDLTSGAARLPLIPIQERARPPNLVRDLAAPKFLGDETNVRRSRRTVNRSATPPAVRAFCGVNPKTRHSRCSLSSQRTDPLSNLTK